MDITFIIFMILIPYIATALGVISATIVKVSKKATQGVMLGFAAGVMLAATVWGLLLPAFDYAVEDSNGINFGIMIITLGFLIGIGCMLSLDKLLPHLHFTTNHQEGMKTHMPRSFLLVMAVALHNIPEGLALGVAIGASMTGDMVTLGGALAMCIGLAIQNFPEGFAVTFPLITEGVNKKRAFWLGQISSLAEPVFSVLGIFLSMWLVPLLPLLLSFAAGAMLFVIAEELIPESQTDSSHIGTYGFMGGFWIMAIISLLLG